MEQIYEIAAKKYREQGLNPIPCSKGKNPIGGWKESQNSQMPADEFARRMNGHCFGIGIICGEGSGGLETIDIDVKNDLYKDDPDNCITVRLFEVIAAHDQSLLDKLRIIETPSGGMHLYYRCSKIEGNQKLAMRHATEEELKINPKEKTKTLIETRGRGGFIVAPPTPGYTVWQENEIPTLSVDERDFLLAACRSLNEVYEPPRQHQPRQQFTGDSPYDTTPWDDYNDRGDIVSLLENHGWKIAYTNGDRIYLTRPGKQHGISADYHSGLKLFKCWSTSTEFVAERAYSHFGVFCLLECNDDPKVATARLEGEYGSRKPRTTPSSRIEQSAGYLNATDPPNDDFLKHVYIPDWDNKPVELPPVLSLCGTPLLTHQNIMSIIAKPGQGKSSAMEAILAAGINAECDALGFSTAGNIPSLYIDNERTNTDVWNSFSRIIKRAGIGWRAESLNFTIAGMRQVARLDQRKKVIEELIRDRKSGLVLIDGAGDLVNDTNDLAEAIECRVWMRELTVKYGISICLTLHPNPNTDKPRGHQGSELCRESESVLLLKSYEEDTRLITSDFEHGKNRNHAPVTAAFRWSDESKMFVSVDYEDMQTGKETRKRANELAALTELARAVLPPPNALSFTALRTAIEVFTGLKERAARGRITAMVGNAVIKLHDDDNYRMIIK